MKALFISMAFLAGACLLVTIFGEIASIFRTDEDAGTLMPDDYRALKNDTKEGRDHENQKKLHE